VSLNIPSTGYLVFAFDAAKHAGRVESSPLLGHRKRAWGLFKQLPIWLIREKFQSPTVIVVGKWCDWVENCIGLARLNLIISWEW
jgi:hypothetical protein